MQLTEADKKHIRHIDFIQATDWIIITSLFVAVGAGIVLALAVLASIVWAIPPLVLWMLGGMQLISWGISWGVSWCSDRKILKYNKGDEDGD